MRKNGRYLKLCRSCRGMCQFLIKDKTTVTGMVCKTCRGTGEET